MEQAIFFYMVYLEGQNSPAYRHETLDSAEREAKRLARIHHKKAFVLCTIKSFEVNEFIERDCRPDTDEMPF